MIMSKLNLRQVKQAEDPTYQALQTKMEQKSESIGYYMIFDVWYYPAYHIDSFSILCEAVTLLSSLY